MIERYGWSHALGQVFHPYSDAGLIPGRVTVQQRGAVTVATDLGDLSATPSGRLMHLADPGAMPVVGDWVAVAARPDEGGGTVHAVLPRRTAFLRKSAGESSGGQVVAANVDVALLVASLNADLNARRLERYLAAAWASGARPVVVLTKGDLCDDPAAQVAAIEQVAIGAPVLAVSAVTGAGVDALAARLRPGETCALLGSSGAGKSSLLNALAGEARMKIGAIREDDARGRHTTTHRELALLPDGLLVLDTPGMRELGLFDADDGLRSAFEDVELISAGCRFKDCAHGSEPGCAVRGALERGELDARRWRGYRKLQRELAHAASRDDPVARAESKRRWAAISKANRAKQRMREE